MLTAREIEKVIGQTVIFPGRKTVSSDEIPNACRKYLCLRDTDETRERIQAAIDLSPETIELTEKPHQVNHDDAVHMVLVLANRVTRDEEAV